MVGSLRLPRDSGHGRDIARGIAIAGVNTLLESRGSAFILDGCVHSGLGRAAGVVYDAPPPTLISFRDQVGILLVLPISDPDFVAGFRTPHQNGRPCAQARLTTPRLQTTVRKRH